MSDSKINQSGGYTTPMLPTDFDGWNIMSHTEIGKRSNQEDRFTYHPQLLNGEYAFFGVFDGTVKEYASEWIHMHILPIFLKSASFTKFHALSTAQKREPDNQALLANALSETYATADQMLIRWCADRQIHYSACTSVTIIIHRPTSAMYVAHVGDSHCVLGTFKKSSKDLVGRSLTRIHRPDSPSERRRIEKNGGSLVYLHGGKPFIRGGDFSQRTRAMQLNYSRAFGGKDLKMYGLSAVPSISRVDLRPRKSGNNDNKSNDGNNDDEDVCLLLGSDGLWDVINPNQGVYVAMKVQRDYAQAQHQLVQRGHPTNVVPDMLNASQALVSMALRNHQKMGSNDNVTCIAIFL